MSRALSAARVDRWIERELVGGLPPHKRKRLHAHLRADAAARARYDRAVLAIRVLEGDDDFAPTEFDLVGRWLAEGWSEPSEASAEQHADSRSPWRRWWPALASAAAAALVLLWVSPLTNDGALTTLAQRDDGWQARGPGHSGSLAVEVLCVTDGVDDPAGPLRIRECGRNDLMGFAYRVAPQVKGTLTLFGVDADGDPMFYMPTPVDTSTAAVQPAYWRGLPMAINVGVNHAQGPLRVFALVSESSPTPQQVEAWVEHLAPHAAAQVGDRPWIERVPAATRSTICPVVSDCHAAELRLLVAP